MKLKKKEEQNEIYIETRKAEEQDLITVELLATMLAVKCLEAGLRLYKHSGILSAVCE